MKFAIVLTDGPAATYGSIVVLRILDELDI